MIFEDLHKLNIEKLVKRNSAGRVTQWFVPEINEYVYNVSMSRVLRVLNLTKQEWYNLHLINKHKDFKYFCPVCGNEIHVGSLTTGYNEVCSRSCHNSHRWDNDEFRQRCGKSISNGLRNAMTDERREQCSMRTKEIMSRPGQREKISITTKIGMHKNNDAAIKKAVQSCKITNALPEVKERRSLAAKAHFNKPGVRDAFKLKAKEIQNRPEVKAKRRKTYIENVLSGKIQVRIRQPFENCKSGHYENAKYCISHTIPYYRSSLELKCIEFFERHEIPYSIEQVKCKFIAPDKTEHIYVADFLVQFNNLNIIIEVKPAKYVHNDWVEAKAMGLCKLLMIDKTYDSYMFVDETVLADDTLFLIMLNSCTKNCDILDIYKYEHTLCKITEQDIEQWFNEHPQFNINTGGYFAANDILEKLD